MRQRRKGKGISAVAMALASAVNLTSPPATQARTEEISVCHLISAEQWAGAEAQIAMLMKALACRCEVRLQAVVLGEGQLADELRCSGIHPHVIGDATGRFLHCYREAEKILRHNRCAILHTHKSKENVLAVLLAKRIGVRHLVRTQHGKPEARTAKDRAVYRLDDFTARYVHRHIAVSADIADFLGSRTQPSRIRVIPNMVNLPRIASDLSPADAKARLQIPLNTPVIGFVGRLERVKRADLFLGVAQKIASKLPDAMFIIAGSGTEEQQLRRLTGELGIAEQVRFLGARDDVPDIMRAMDTLLITSDHEGMPTALLEAMALRVPLVARAVGGIPEVLVDGHSGRLVLSSDSDDIAAATLRTLSDKTSTSIVAEHAFETVQRYSVCANVDAVVKVYRELTAEARING
ncbi:MAG TPA: glycosyltransferase [Terriglobales bacterium]|jgi:glycosyltransferase involved in cell wall biosynthesis